MGGFAAEAALAAARGEAVPEYRALRSVLVELMAARTQVRRHGEAPGWLERAAAGADGGVARLDATAEAVAGVLRRRDR